jgi:hypothetical protein
MTLLILQCFMTYIRNIIFKVVYVPRSNQIILKKLTLILYDYILNKYFDVVNLNGNK